MQNNVDNRATQDPLDGFRCGTLEYTKRGLIVLFFWLLWGDFCFSIMESVFPNITPLALKGLNAPNWVIGLVMTTIPGILNFIVCPWVSFKSDRHRGKWGRRIPFLLFPTPWLCLFLVLLAYAPEVGRFIAHLMFAGSKAQESLVILCLMGFFVAGFQYFNMFVASVYYYLFNDVVPEKHLGTFMALFRVVGSLAGAAFQFFILQYAESHMKLIFVGAAALYFVVFSLMCLRVKEGEYPPPPENVDGRVGLFSSMKTYFVECFCHRFYWLFFLSTTAWDISACITPWNILFLRDSLGLQLKQIGYINGISSILSACILLPAGIIADRKHPLRMILLAMGGLVLLMPIKFIYLFNNFPPNVVYHIEFVLAMVFLPLSALFSASNLPMYMRLLPTERYGQFCAAQAMVRSLAVMAGGMLVGALMDVAKNITMAHGMAATYFYRFAPVWSWICQLTAFVLTVVLYRYWKQYGGDKSYKAPAVGAEVQSEAAAATASE